MDATEFQEFIAHCYQQPRVDLGPEALRWYVRYPQGRR
jgi:hypothetical protein